jgi:hypothetical protein
MLQIHLPNNLSVSGHRDLQYNYECYMALALSIGTFSSSLEVTFMAQVGCLPGWV